MSSLLDIKDWRNILETEIARIKAQAGKVVQTDLMLREAKDLNNRLSSIKDAQVQSMARVNLAKIEVLQIKNPQVEKAALDMATRMGDLKTQLEGDPLFKAILEKGSINLGILGSAPIDKISKAMSMVTGFIGQSKDTVKMINEHIAAVEAIRRNVNETADVAEGRGFKVGLQKLIVGYTQAIPGILSDVKWATWGIAAAILGGLVFFYIPRPRGRK